MGSVTHWIQEIHEGDREAAASALSARYFERLVRYARHKLHGRRRRTADEEDVAAAAFSSFWRAATQGRFPNLADRNGLWRLLLCITARKAADLRKRDRHERRHVRGESVMPGWKSEDERRAMGEVLGDVPGPEVVAASTEECGRLLALLKEPRLKEVALAKLQGFTNTEIAARIGCSERTIERELSLIRKLWEHDAPS